MQCCHCGSSVEVHYLWFMTNNETGSVHQQERAEQRQNFKVRLSKKERGGGVGGLGESSLSYV